MDIQLNLSLLCAPVPEKLEDLPQLTPLRTDIPHAPKRINNLNESEKQKAVENHLRYFPVNLHAILGKEFADELEKYGHIYMYRFRPFMLEMKAYPIQNYPCNCKEAACIMINIMNNLSDNIAQFPEELVTYGGNGQVFSNWIQFRLTMYYLSQLTKEQTLVLVSGHPQGLFPSTESASRMVISNGMMIPNYSSMELYRKLFALGVTMYGQMTAGSFCYIGPQGIVHGTTITLLNAGRKYLGTSDLTGIVYVTSGLGGMSGAQAKAATIVGCIGVIAEVSLEAIIKRHKQGWLSIYFSDLDRVISEIRICKKKKISKSIGYHGNVVNLWKKLGEVFEEENELLVDLGSDQTSCHDVFGGGYYPVNYENGRTLLVTDKKKFEALVEESLRQQVLAINKLSEKGMKFWDYGNAFLLEASKAKANVISKKKTSDIVGIGGSKFIYPSYFEDIMGDVFSAGFGPFRWMCTSCLESDLDQTDEIAVEIFERLVGEENDERVKEHLRDNLKWIKEAKKNNLVVGTFSRILYSNERARLMLAEQFHGAIKNGNIKASIILSRDHHDVSGTDSPFRETANITDGSAYCADMAVQNAIGLSTRGATWVALHNGGGVGWGEVMNGGFGMVLDGTEMNVKKAKAMLSWDVLNGIVRRGWSGNSVAISAGRKAMSSNSQLNITLPKE